MSRDDDFYDMDRRPGGGGGAVGALAACGAIALVAGALVLLAYVLTH